MSRRSGLGRGLGALIPSDLVNSEQDQFRELPLSAIEPNRYQPREHFDEAALLALSDSIRELGVLQPVLVRPGEGDRFELIAGERRWRAARKAGLTTIPAIIRTIEDDASLEQALVENLHRADLHPMEEAAAYQQLMEDFGLTQEQVAARVGKSRPAIANTLRLLQLPAAVQRLVAEGRLSAGHARAVLATPDRNRQEQLARQIVEEGWTVRQVEDALRHDAFDQAAAAAVVSQPASPPDPADPVDRAAPSGSAAATAAAGSPPAAAGAAPTGGSAPSTTGTAAPAPASAGARPSPASARPAPVVAPDRELPSAGLLELEQLLADYFETTVRIAGGRGKGRITIEFADLGDLERIYRLIVEGA
ncbi:MAG: ParB/RepB/Spo0J family partition protein [Acidimicrobiales bacterium]